MSGDNSGRLLCRNLQTGLNGDHVGKMGNLAASGYTLTGLANCRYKVVNQEAFL